MDNWSWNYKQFHSFLFSVSSKTTETALTTMYCVSTGLGNTLLNQGRLSELGEGKVTP